MNEELLMQLHDVLLKNGVDEETIKKTLDELDVESEKEDVEEVALEEQTETPEEVVNEEEVTPEEVVAETEEVLPPQEEVVAQEQMQQVNDELQARVDELGGTLDELQKANEGLLARIAALEEALTNAGVIDRQNQVADTQGTFQQAQANENLENPMDKFLAKVKGNKRY